MAELVGVISGALTIGALAANIATSVTKLKSYWDRIEGAPDDIRWLIEELETLCIIFDDIRDDQARNPVSSLLLDGTARNRCLENARKAAERLRRLVDDVASYMDVEGRWRKKVASAKVLFRKDMIEKCKADLEGAIRLLGLSQQIYHSALIRLQPDIIVARLSQASTSSTTSTVLSTQDYKQPDLPRTSPPEAALSKRNQSGSLSRRYDWGFTSPFNALGSLSLVIKHDLEENRCDSQVSEDAEKSRQITASYRGPAWLVNRAWKMHASNACNGWDFTIRQFNVMSNDSPIFRYAQEGNVLGLQELFSRREASVYDCDECGWTALWHAVTWGKPSTSKLLICLGSGVDGAHSGYSSLLSMAMINTNTLCSQEDFAAMLDISRHLLEMADTDSAFLGNYCGPEEGFSFWQQQLQPDYYSEGFLLKRVAVAIALVRYSWAGNSELCRKSLARDKIVPKLAVNMKNSSGETLLHALGIVIRDWIEPMSFWPARRVWWGPLNDVENSTAGWRALLKELISKGADLHTTALNGETPLQYLLFETRYHLDISTTDLNDTHPKMVEEWVTSLAQCGIDLDAYGQREQELLQERRVSFYCADLVRVEDDAQQHKVWRLVSLTYGSKPSDWDVTFELVSEEEDEEPGAIPGGWVEDD